MNSYNSLPFTPLAAWTIACTKYFIIPIKIYDKNIFFYLVTSLFAVPDDYTVNIPLDFKF